MARKKCLAGFEGEIVDLMFACEVAVQTTGGMLERAISMERVTMPM